MSIFDDIRRDVEAGTPGPWTFEIENGDWPDQYLIDGNGDPVLEWDFDLGFCISAPNARRISRTPTVEGIALAAEELMDFADGAFREAYSLTKHIEGADRLYERRKAALAKLREASK